MADEISIQFTRETLRGKRVPVDHGGRPLVRFESACHRRGLDVNAITAVNDAVAAPPAA